MKRTINLVNDEKLDIELELTEDIKKRYHIRDIILKASFCGFIICFLGLITLAFFHVDGMVLNIIGSIAVIGLTVSAISLLVNGFNNEYALVDNIKEIKNIINNINDLKKTFFSSDYDSIIFFTKDDNSLSKMYLPIDEKRYYDSDDFTLTYNKKSHNIILYIPVKYSPDFACLK